MNQSEKRLFLIQSLLKENPAYRDWGVPQDADDSPKDDATEDDEL